VKNNEECKNLIFNIKEKNPSVFLTLIQQEELKNSEQNKGNNDNNVLIYSSDFYKIMKDTFNNQELNAKSKADTITSKIPYSNVSKNKKFQSNTNNYENDSIQSTPTPVTQNKNTNTYPNKENLTKNGNKNKKRKNSYLANEKVDSTIQNNNTYTSIISPEQLFYTSDGKNNTNNNQTIQTVSFDPFKEHNDNEILNEKSAKKNFNNKNSKENWRKPQHGNSNDQKYQNNEETVNYNRKGNLNQKNNYYEQTGYNQQSENFNNPYEDYYQDSYNNNYYNQNGKKGNNFNRKTSGQQGQQNQQGYQSNQTNNYYGKKNSYSKY
jgi:hypothetical protein